MAVVADEDWMSQFDAADRLGIGLGRIGLVIAGGRLIPVHDSCGRAGVQRHSVECEAERREGAGEFRSACLLLADIGRSLLRSI